MDAEAAAAFEAGVSLARSGRFDEAAAALQFSVARQPDFYDALYELAYVLQDLGRMPDALAGFARALDVRPDSVDAWNGHGLVLRDQERWSEALTSFGHALGIQPDSAKVLCNRSLALSALERYDDAMADCDQALAIAPGMLQARIMRGLVLEAMKRFEEAWQTLQGVVADYPDHYGAWINMATVLRRMDRNADSLHAYQQALALQPDSSAAHDGCGLNLTALGRHAEALVMYDRALALPNADDVVIWHACLARLQCGELERGWSRFDARWRVKPLNESPLLARFGDAEWDGKSDLAGKTLLVHWEQGFGDTIQFCRYIPVLAQRGIRVAFEVQKPLKSLMAGLDGVAELVADGDPLPRHDAHCALMSLPQALVTTLATIPANVPYLKVPADRALRWADRLSALPAGRPRIGLVWAGNPLYGNDVNRSVNLKQMLTLVSDRAQFVCLQKEVSAANRDVLKDYPNIAIFAEQLGDFSDTAALVAAMDLVISVDTSVAHLAGALGKPVWTLLPLNPDWRWMLERPDTPWYPSMRLFRQTRFQDWDFVLADIGVALDGWLARR